MSYDKAETRYRNGRRLMLVAASFYALSRALTYLPNPDRETPRALELFSLIIPEGVFAGLWIAVMCLCVRDLIKGVGRLGIASLVGMLFFWGTIYAMSYITTVIDEGWGSREWSSASGFLLLGGIIMGLLMKVGALKSPKSES